MLCLSNGKMLNTHLQIVRATDKGYGIHAHKALHTICGANVDYKLPQSLVPTALWQNSADYFCKKI